MRNATPSIVWLRQDLRIEDNPALFHAANGPLLVVYILDDQDPWKPGGAAKWWLHKSLTSLSERFKAMGVPFILRRGDPLTILQDLVHKTGATSIYWNRCYEPYAIHRDTKIKSWFKTCDSYNGSLLCEPWDIKKAYQVFTPFWKALQERPVTPVLPKPKLEGWRGDVSTESLDDWKLLPTLWGQGFDSEWTPGETGALEAFDGFLENGIQEYTAQRDYPSVQGTSKLSPHLHWGEISPRQIWHKVRKTHGPDCMPFLRQLGWREFSTHLLYHFPHLPEKPLKPAFENFTWDSNPEALQAWQRGMTGYPLVDAGMRQLWHTGWMHNRVRMVVASFLVKDLLIPWQMGEAWFWDTLVDADLANNAISWQWVAGCGADAAPYFRIFNPVTQSQKFDPEGLYIKTWVPELRGLDSKLIHTPWLAGSVETYPKPIVDHGKARERALSVYRSL